MTDPLARGQRLTRRQPVARAREGSLAVRSCHRADGCRGGGPHHLVSAHRRRCLAAVPASRDRLDVTHSRCVARAEPGGPGPGPLPRVALAVGRVVVVLDANVLDGIAVTDLMATMTTMTTGGCTARAGVHRSWTRSGATSTAGRRSRNKRPGPMCPPAANVLPDRRPARHGRAASRAWRNRRSCAAAVASCCGAAPRTASTVLASSR